MIDFSDKGDVLIDGLPSSKVEYRDWNFGRVQESRPVVGGNV